MVKVSIIIPCYNQGQYVAEAINSALSQTYSDIEIVCINDGSTDNTHKIIKSFADKYKNILYINSEKNNGVIYSRNTAINACHGEYILPLDADDKIESAYVEKAVKILDTNPNIGIVYCKARIFGKKNRNWKLKKFNKSDILYENCIFNTALFRKSDFLKVGMYKNYMMNGMEDFDLWLSFIEQGLDVYQIDEVLFYYRKYDQETRTQIFQKNQNEIWLSVIKNHINLYLNDRQFLERLIFSKPLEARKKYKKYKNIFYILLAITAIELMIILIFIITLVWRGNV